MTVLFLRMPANAVVPELPGCSAFGECEEEALKGVMTAIELWLETAKKERIEIPLPSGKKVLEAIIGEMPTVRFPQAQKGGVE